MRQFYRSLRPGARQGLCIHTCFTTRPMPGFSTATRFERNRVRLVIVLVVVAIRHLARSRHPPAIDRVGQALVIHV